MHTAAEARGSAPHPDSSVRPRQGATPLCCIVFACFPVTVAFSLLQMGAAAVAVVFVSAAVAAL